MLKSSPTTTLVSKIVLSDGSTLSYEYDAEERITSVTDKHVVNGEVIETTYEYTYDALGQLLNETVNGVAVNTITYDNYGNIRTRNGKTYTYGDSKWKDLLTEYDGQTITYDDGGNPINYLGHTLTWEKGRQLKSFDDITYTYNANGIRTSKTVNGVKHEYTLDGTNIVKETWDGNTLVPLYDNTESVCGITYNCTSYYFLKNLQGDVIAITDATGTVVARYNYDAWGVCTIESDTTDCKIAEINPYRYRTYYLDQEIGMYYLQSRYYEPQVGRFINADEAMYIRRTRMVYSHNIMKYCNNNPINFKDSSGYAEYKNGSYINEQRDNTKINGIKMEKIKFGVLGNVSDNGCGAIAVYNALLPYLGKRINFNNILKSVDDKALLLGLAGANPKTIDKYLKKQKFLKCILKFDGFTNFDVVSYSNMIMLTERLCKSVILLYNYSSSLLHWHYVAGIRKSGVKFKFYNANYSNKNYSLFDYIDKLNANGIVTMMIWGIL